jgi:hypothetical protein
MLYTITISFCPAVQLARSLMEYRKNRSLIPDKHIVVQGHYPVNKKKNNRDIEMVVEAYGEAELWDPGSDLGSAQSQNWALKKLKAGNRDYFINWDPDSNCREKGWDRAALCLLEEDTDCVLVSCWSHLWNPFKERTKEYFSNSHKFYYLKAIHPVPFNLSLFSCEFIDTIGGLAQWGEKWGELEAPFHHACLKHNKYHAYLKDYIEEESGKYMQDRPLLEYKDAYLRTLGPEQFVGQYHEFLAWKYPELLALDTAIPDNTEFK